jgi:hypothetical protein
MFLGMFKPKLVLWWSPQCKRFKVLQFYLLGTFVSILSAVAIGEKSNPLSKGMAIVVWLFWVELWRRMRKAIPLPIPSTAEDGLESSHEIEADMSQQPPPENINEYNHAQESPPREDPPAPPEESISAVEDDDATDGDALVDTDPSPHIESVPCKLCSQPAPIGHEYCHSCVWKTKWARHILDAPENSGRRERAHLTNLISIKRDVPEGLFQGSAKKPYVTTLKACTCKDFALRQLPCKHMYRLAHELGVYSLETIERDIEPRHEYPAEEFDLTMSDEYPAEEFDSTMPDEYPTEEFDLTMPDESRAEEFDSRILEEFDATILDENSVGEFDSTILLDKLPESAQKDLLFLLINSTEDSLEWVYKKEDPQCQMLIKSGFIESVDQPEKLLEMKHIADLRAPLKEAGLKGFPTKEKVIAALLDLNPNAADDLKQKYIVVRLKKHWQEARKQLRRHLRERVSYHKAEFYSKFYNHHG